MKCTFYRPQNVNTIEFDNIIGKLRYDLHLLETEETNEWNIYTYFYSLSRLTKPLANNPKMNFLGLEDPERMPSDTRVEYFYKPTYIATAFMMKAVLKYPSLMTESDFLDSDLDFTIETVKHTLATCMLGCTGRDFDGAGVFFLKDCIKLFEDAGASEFIEKYPDLCPEFTELYKERKAFVESGNIDPIEAWYNHELFAD